MDDTLTAVKQQVAAEQSKKEWWEELFPPAFPQGDPDAGKKEEEDMRRMFSAFDKTALQKKYQTVWNELYGAESANQMQANENAATRPKTTGTGVRESVESVQSQSLREGAIWNDEEMRTLRRNMRALRVLSRSALLELKEATNSNKLLKAKLQSSTSKLQRTDEALREAVKANERLSILVDCLKKRNEELETQLSLREADLRALIEDRNSKKGKANDLTKQNNELHVQNRRLEFQLETVREEHARQLEEVKQKLTVERELQVSALRHKLSSVQCDLDKEATEHGVTKKALDRLSKHFVTLQNEDARAKGGTYDGDRLEVNDLPRQGASQSAKTRQQRKPQQRNAVEAYFDINELNNLHSLNELLNDLKAS